MKETKRELTDLAVNEIGALVEISGRGRVLEYNDFGFPRLQFTEKLVNKISDCYQMQGWCEENYYQEEDSQYKDQELSVCFGFSSKYVDPYRGW